MQPTVHYSLLFIIIEPDSYPAAPHGLRVVDGNCFFSMVIEMNCIDYVDWDGSKHPIHLDGILQN